MNITLLNWCVIILAFCAANVPFINQQLFAVLRVNKDAAYRKSLWLRLAELVVLYFIVGAIAWMFEANIGNAFAQKWEFYAITGCLFLVFAYPGFVYRYLRKQSRMQDS